VETQRTCDNTVGGKSVDYEPTMMSKGKDGVYSEINTPPTTTIGRGKDKFSMSECAAYEPTMSANGGEKEDHYEVVDSVSHV